MMMRPILPALVGSLLVATACAQVDSARVPVPTAQPSELGAVRWLRDFDAGTAAARKQDRPMLMLFQEVPG